MTTAVCRSACEHGLVHWAKQQHCVGRQWKMARLLAVFRGSCLFQSTQRLPSIEKNVQQLLRFKTTSNETVSPHGYFIFRPFAWYNERLTKRPLLTKAFTAGVLYSVGDVIAQRVSLRDAPLDRPRMLRAAIYGTFIVAPLAHLHFNFLNWLVVEKLAVRTLLVPFVKVYFDQFVYWAPSIVAIYHLSMGFMEGLSPSECIERFKALYWRSLKANWMIWAPMMIVNFSFIPVAHQLNFCLIVGMMWATVISYIRGRGVRIKRHYPSTRPADPETIPRRSEGKADAFILVASTVAPTTKPMREIKEIVPITEVIYPRK
ncbi:protein SYM1 [Nematostella vectensis]|uniref:protein SYM1 n=1 Tax=Nematostella vectensis TaxID=45351 RepID=UPI00138FE2C7|nr:protein SYM1 [Nematostella vectensis]